MRRRVFRNPSYREAIDYIAYNDEPTELDPAAMLGMPSVQLVAAIFGTPAKVVADDVVRYRKKHAI